MKRVVLIFARNLKYGEVKTRLAATAGDEVAFAVYKELLKYTQTITQDVAADKIVFFSNNIEEGDIWEDKIFSKQIQSGNDLGKRMQNAFIYAFENGYEKAVIIGTDCFELSSAIITEALDQLRNHDVVIGPATDGGYYLLGMKKNNSKIFEDKIWSTPSVFKDSMNTIGKLQLSCYQLETLNDVDEEKDLPESFKRE
ncbi:MAG: TIGR04282 family arsenosugar biosynthesis glycosyltransferase [Chitinophagaceae bacterium]|nr:TIGR04282 family arsenosugar biosynthesis glycosyltransferase [Chitinophagaceae bacterium]